MIAPARDRAPVHRIPYRRWITIGGPLFISSVVTTFGPILHMAIAALAGGFAIAWLSSRPGWALRALAVVLPLQLLVLSALYEAGLPRELVRPLGFVKEALVGGIVVAAVRAARRDRVRFDVVDKLALAYVGLASLLLVFPGVLVDGPGADIAFGTRLNGFRTDAMYIVLFVAARHARIPAAQVVQAAKTCIAVAAAAAVVAIFEFFAAGTWNRFVTQTIGLTRYKIEVQNVQPGLDPYLFDVRAYSVVGGRELLRIGGILVDYLQFGFWLTLAVALALERQVRGLERPVRGLVIGLLALPVLFTQTRSAVVGLGLVAVLALRRQRGRATGARVRVALVVGALATVAVPIAVGIGLADRLGGEGDEHSDDLHSASTSEGIAALFDEPAGRGLATSAGAGQREEADQAIVTENQLQQIGTQLGIVGMLLWVGTYAGAVLTNRRVIDAVDARGDPDVVGAQSVLGGTTLALTALVPSMFVLQIHIYFAFAWTMWALAGAALGAVESRTPSAVAHEPARA